ncbi:MAG: hypothetical protein EP315_01640 [Gammaproteobacteria bacterium]|nr:MAG: hypothetical protein EP315_01640 [Gammaproteobacteria bacterium]
MSKFSSKDSNVQHWVLPELSGEIVGFSSDGMRLQTVEEIELLQKQAFEEGRQEGFKAGLEEVKARARKLDDMFRFLDKPLQKLDAEVEQQLTELALTVGRLLLKKECSTDAAVITGIIHEALEFLPVSARNVRVKLNPADIELMRQAGFNVDQQEWKCVADRTVTQGGCMVESDTSHIDATLETRVSQIIDQLTEHRPHHDND